MVLTVAANTATGVVVVVDGGVVRVVVVSSTLVGGATALDVGVAGGVDVVESPPGTDSAAVGLRDVTWEGVASPDSPWLHDATAPADMKRTAASRYRLRGPRGRLG
jgi:hypothetical protein